MPISTEVAAELQILRMFDSANHQTGLKVHSNAAPELIAATRRLYEKQLITHVDGGYPTPLGSECCEHLQKLLHILNSKPLL